MLFSRKHTLAPISAAFRSAKFPKKAISDTPSKRLKPAESGGRRNSSEDGVSHYGLGVCQKICHRSQRQHRQIHKLKYISYAKTRVDPNRASVT